MATYGVVLEEWEQEAARPRAMSSLGASGLHTAEGFAAIEDGTALVQPAPPLAPATAAAGDEPGSRMARWIAALCPARP